jgi:hypothetical protein
MPYFPKQKIHQIEHHYCYISHMSKSCSQHILVIFNQVFNHAVFISFICSANNTSYFAFVLPLPVIFVSILAL